MEALIKKLNFTNQATALLLNVPTELADLTAALGARTSVAQQLESTENAQFVMAFVQQLNQVEQMANWVALHTEGDAVVWLVYPKQSSKNYTCAFNRDTGWASMGAAGFEPVRMVAVNDDWSALRFRRVGFVKKMTRDPKGALTAEGRSRVGLG
ncbi:hypothetical protein [Rudanella lutea]|uniref:hypothetical protein n=1 Tax=Rudanella lutea TaxID=451374 RepID=UPI00036B6ED3|nr:hypothetical protein [Rudanella lutea]